MWAAGPTARATFAFGEVFYCATDMVVASLLFFDRDGPADPFVPSQGSNVIPGGNSFWGSYERRPKVFGDGVQIGAC